MFGYYLKGYNSYMEKATISEIKNHLSSYLRKVKAGVTVLILDRDQPVARLESVRKARKGEGSIARLERAGMLKRGTAPSPLKILRPDPPKSTKSVLDALLDERSEGR